MQAAVRHIFRGSVAAGTAGASAAALAPSNADCRAARPEPPPKAPVKDVDGVVVTSPKTIADTQDGWITTDDLTFSFVEVDEAISVLGDSDTGESMQEILAISGGRCRPDVGAAESPRSNDSESAATSGSEADEKIRSPLTTALSNNAHLSIIIEQLLNNNEVQQAVSNSLNEIPEFANLLRAEEVSEIALPAVRPTASLLLPAIASVGYERCSVTERNVFEKAVATLKQSLANVGSNLASFFGGITCNLRNLGRGDSGCVKEGEEIASCAGAGRSGEYSAERRAVWKGALFSLAIAVFVMIIYKRHHVVRFRTA